MKVPFRRLAAALVAAGFCTAIGITPAHANLNALCANENQCLDDWANGGSNNTIRVYPDNNSNEDFNVVLITGRCGGGLVTSNCPFKNTHFDQEYLGWPIDEISYESTGLCIANTVDGVVPDFAAALGTCNNVYTGAGGANGTIFIDHDWYWISLYWTNQGQSGNNADCMMPVGSTGTSSQVDLNWPTNNGCDRWIPGSS